MAQPDLIIFAKKPIPGQVKTRLQPVYSPEQAADIASFLIRATVELAVGSWPGDIILAAWPDPDHGIFHELADRYRIRLEKQGEGDLGEKMRTALDAGIAREGAAAIMGCDVPYCRWDILDQANDWLVRGRNVIGPTEDGGYYFIGLHECSQQLFEGIQWGGREVFQSTLAQAGSLGMEFERLSKLRDLDTPEDLWLAAEEYEPLRRFLIKVL